MSLPSGSTETWYTSGGRYRNSTGVDLHHSRGTPTFGTAADDEGGNVFVDVDTPHPMPQ